ncbi:hydrolase [Salipaludibacillus keqinensis]|uniref:Hydrolase n=1 Tax=Salipaludibacillus keqinensis TaxID=2045207 RepID=A0A323TCV3_9BACI|nr:HAD family hydrolase [Salipaludibacillus keqinensis]PYZ92034.1 hydrolase [Salipaludibacillus keqinensis]
MKKLYIFDLDGTLYEGKDHFDYYAQLLMNDVPLSKRSSFMEDYEKMKAGDHVVAIGKAYDVKRDLAVTVDPITLTVVEAHKWNGQKVENIESIYGNKPVQFDFEELVAIGDGWWLPFASAKHYGVENCHPRYMQTKEYMVSDQFSLDAIPGLREFLLHVQKTDHILLMTNSDKEDVLRLLHELNLTNVFDHVISSAKKPSRTKEFFKELQGIYDLPYDRLVSVGDNFLNEIAPALLLGMQAVYISEHPHKTEHKNLLQVPSITDWMEQMER